MFKIELRTSEDNKTYWVLVGGNGNEVSTSKMHDRKSNAKSTALKVHKAMPDSKFIDKTI